MAANDLKELIEECLRSLDPTIDLSAGSPAQSKVVARILNFVGSDPFQTDFVSFARSRIAEAYPHLARESMDPLNELLVTPATIFIDPVAREIQQIRLRQSLESLEYHTDASLDAAVSNLFIERILGEYARGVARLYFTSPRYVAATVEKQFTTSDGLNFYPVFDQYITAAQMAYNREGEYYYFDVRLVSQYPGDEYNISSNAISSVTGISAYEKVTNRNSFTGGTKREDNDELYSRARNLPTEIAPNTYRGIIHLIRESYPAITYLQMVGYGDTEMVRDIIRGGGYGPIVAHSTTASFVEDGDYDSYTNRIYCAAIDFEALFGNLGVPSKPGSLTLSWTHSAVTTKQDYDITSIVDSDIIAIDGTFPLSATINNLDMRYKSLTIADMPLFAYTGEFTSFDVFDQAHIGGCIDVWARDPEPVESSTILPVISDEVFFAAGLNAKIVSTADYVYLYDATSDVYMGGTGVTVSGVDPHVIYLNDIAPGAQAIPLDMSIGDIIEVTGTGGTFSYIITAITIEPTRLVITITEETGSIGTPSSYKLIDYSRQFKKGWGVRLTSGEVGVYKIIQTANFTSADNLYRGARLTVNYTFTTSSSLNPWVIYDNFDINLSEPKNIKVSDDDLVCSLGNRIVSSSSGLNYETLGVAEGDVLRILNGLNAGDYTVESITGVSKDKLLLTTPVPYAQSNAEYIVYTAQTGVSLPLLRVSEAAVLDPAGTRITVPCRDVLAVVSQGITNMGAGQKMKIGGVQVGLVSSIPDEYNVNGDTLTLKIIRRLKFSASVTEQVLTYSIAFSGSDPIDIDDVIDQINTEVGTPIATKIEKGTEEYLALRPINDEAILIADGATTSALGMTSGNCAKYSTGSYTGYLVSYGIHTLTTPRPSVWGESDYVYFESGTNSGAMRPWSDLPSGSTYHIILDKFSGLKPQPPWEGNTIIIGYPSTGYFRMYFKDPTKLLIDGSHIVSVINSDGATLNYTPDPAKYALISPPYPETSRHVAKAITVSTKTVTVSSTTEAKAIRELLPKEFSDGRVSTYVDPMDTFYFFYRRVWFYKNLNGIATFDLDTETLSFSVDNGPIKTVNFSDGMTLNDIVERINNTHPNTAEIDADSHGTNKYLCLNSQYLISNISASAGLLTDLGALVPTGATTNKSLNYNFHTHFVFIDALNSKIYYEGDLADEGSVGDSGLEGPVTGNPKIQYELRRYGAQLVTSSEMQDNTYETFYYADVDMMSIGVGDTFNVTQDTTGTINSSPALGYTLSTDEARSFSPGEVLRMQITTTIAEPDINSSPQYERFLEDDLSIVYDYSETVANVHTLLASDNERVLCASVVAKHMVPYYISGNIAYTGGPSTDTALTAIKELVEGLRENERIEVSDIIQLLVNQGANYVQLPVVLAILGQDTTRKLVLHLVKDTSTLSRLAAFYIDDLNLTRG